MGLRYIRFYRSTHNFCCRLQGLDPVVYALCGRASHFGPKSFSRPSTHDCSREERDAKRGNREFVLLST